MSVSSSAAPTLGPGFEVDDGAFLGGGAEGHSLGRSGDGASGVGIGGGGGGGVGAVLPNRDMPPSVLKILVTNNVAGGARARPADDHRMIVKAQIFRARVLWPRSGTWTFR